MDESLFTTRQLTEYREWPDGRKGCLFYIPKLQKFDAEEFGGIYLVKSTFRKLDKIGEFNQLHEAELQALNQDDCIIANFGAFLYSVEFDWAAEKNYDTVIDYWHDYCEWMNQFQTPEEDEWDRLFPESRLWLQRNKDFLTAYTGYRRDSFKQYLFDRIVLNEVMKKMSSTYDWMWNVSPYIQIPNKTGATYKIEGNDLPEKKDAKLYSDQLGKQYPIQYYIYRDSKKIALTRCHEEFHLLWYDNKKDCLVPILEYSEEDGDIISGFPAMFTNFIASHWVYEQIINSSEPDVRTKLLLKSFSPSESSIDIGALEFSFFGMDCEEVYKNYIKILLKNAEYAGKAKSHDPLDSEQRKQWRYYATAFDIEKSLYELGQDIYVYLSNEQAETLRTYTRDFFRYLLKMIEGSEFYEEELQAFNELFGEEKQNKPSYNESEIDVPQEKDRFRYVKLVKWLKVQKELGNDYLTDAGNNRSQMCRDLKKILGWQPDQGALRKAQERN